MRGQLFSVLFDEWKVENGERVVTSSSPYHENSGLRFLYTSFFAGCAAVQVVDAVQTWALEEHGQKLEYGPVSLDCKCCSLYAPNGKPVRTLPYPKSWEASVPEKMVR